MDKKQIFKPFYSSICLCLFFTLIHYSCRKELSPYGKYENQEPLPAQFKEVVLVYLKDKGLNEFSLENGSALLSERALQRRQQQNIPLDSTDLPVSKKYVTTLLELTNGKLLNTSRWLNYAVIHLPENSSSIDEIKKLPYVDSVRSLGIHAPYETSLFPPGNTADVNPTGSISALDTIKNKAEAYGATHTLLEQYNATFLPQEGFFGKGKYIAILSDGFGYINEKPEIAHLLQEKRITFTYDFIFGKTDLSTTTSSGNDLLGMLGAINPRKYIGLAPKADFALMRTDMSGAQEPYFETSWVAALECADSLGVDIISSSCVYGVKYDDPKFNITAANANGSSISSLAADISFKKGMLTIQVFPQKSSAVTFILPPSDAKNIITVGNLTKYNSPMWSNLNIPTTDGRMKPELAVLAEEIPVIYGWGDSYSTIHTPPIMAGLFAALWEAMPNKSAKELKEIVEKTASQAQSRNNILGYGIPNLKKAYELK